MVRTFLAAALAAALVLPMTADAADAPARTPIDRADQLPRRDYALPKLPSELVAGPLAELMPLAEALDRDIASDLATYEIRDNATLRSLIGTRLSVEVLRGRWAAVAPLAAELRALQDKPAGRRTTGVVMEAVAQAKLAGGGADAERDAVRSIVAQRFGAMDYAEVADTIKGLKGQLELANRELVIGGLRAQLDPAARNAGMKFSGSGVATIVNARAQLDALLPVAPAVVAALQPIIDANTTAKPDRWTARLVTLAPDAKASEVVVGIWDSGVDMALFKPAAQKGLAFDDLGNPVRNLLRDLGPAAPRWPELKSMTKGALDLRAALDTPEARALKTKVAGLKADEAKAFQEDLSLAGLYVHGTHVAGIAVDGNPFARVYPVSMHWSHLTEPTKPTDALSRRIAANYGTIVDGLRKANVRVVNMSWRYGPTFYEGALAFHGIGKDAAERREMAARLFAIERDALKAAIASAPEILFVAGSGNEDNSADFVEYIPAGLELPNLVTAGAVDQAGEETSFSSFGRTVVVHANGFEVPSVVPGGDRMKLSGTSMAAPQVTNLAAKLFALKPSLTPVQVKALILEGAHRNGRVNLIDPKGTIEKLAGA